MGVLVQTLPGLPHWGYVLGQLVAGLAVGGLGWHARDCPPRCPGTDRNGKPRAPRTLALQGLLAACFLGGVLLVIAAMLLSGCTYARTSVTRTRLENGVLVTEKAAISGAAVLDSNQALQRASAHALNTTSNTWSPTVSMTGLTQAASSTGIVVIINGLVPAAAGAALK
jgi:hypothetical protein